MEERCVLLVHSILCFPFCLVGNKMSFFLVVLNSLSYDFCTVIAEHKYLANYAEDLFFFFFVCYYISILGRRARLCETYLEVSARSPIFDF